ncbi:MAG: type II secretion system protein [Thermoguttaceae bacterium]|nr:type II secretion system protein [Thermoguttaceae bacterium]
MKRLREQRRGVTLIELLVVATIILIVTAASVPTIKPMMESQLTRQAGSTVSTYLNRARARAAATGRPCGVTFEHFAGTYDDGGTPDDPTDDFGNASLVLRQVETPPYYCGLEQGAAVDVYAEDDIYDGDKRLRRIRVVNDSYWGAMVGDEKGAKIQFNGVGPYYPIVVDRSVDPPLFFIEKLPGIDLPILQNATFKVVRDPRPTMTAPVGLPQGAVVDLEWSGTDDSSFALGYLDENDVPRGHNVTVMFSPDGSVDYVENNGRFTPTDAIYFLIGRWDRISALGLDVDDLGEIRPTIEDRLWNYEDPTNAWVSINPTSGLVTTTEVSSPVDYLVGDAIGGLYESREFARMSKRNTGGR